MFELFDTRPDANVQDPEYQRLLGYPAHHTMEGRARELADWARGWFEKHGRPWIYARDTHPLELAEEHLKLDGIELGSGFLTNQFREAGAHGAVLLAVSAGTECEAAARKLWDQGKPDEYFFLEMFGSAVVEHLAAVASGRICAWAEQNGQAVLPRYSPGYSGWDVGEQPKLWQLIQRPTDAEISPTRGARNGSSGDGGNHAGEGFGDGPSRNRLQLEVLPSGMLRPKKSLLALLGLTRHLDRVRPHSRLIPCERCSLLPCQYRRAPYLEAPPQAEDGRRLQPGESIPDAIPRLERDARYAFNARALRKWSVERLQFERSEDGSVSARFRYDGTTCSNLGRPLEYHYAIRLSSRREGYRILGAECRPGPQDSGHAHQCEYLADPEDFTRRVAAERPLLGQPLNQVLAWKRPFSPAGCYCDAQSRDHKWGLVLEVIHFALVQQEQGAGAHANGEPNLQNTRHD